jgi:hypothetical protein
MATNILSLLTALAFVGLAAHHLIVMYGANEDSRWNDGTLKWRIIAGATRAREPGVYWTQAAICSAILFLGLGLAISAGASIFSL